MYQPRANVPQITAYVQVCRKLEEPGTLMVGIDAAKGRHMGVCRSRMGRCF